MKVLFVCLGNICRSPTAESVFRKKATDSIRWLFDSAGTSGNHVGESSDPRSIKHANARGYTMTHRARQFSAEDFRVFDLILVMDQSNHRNILGLASDADVEKVKLVTEYCLKPHPGYIPDPYYGGSAEFEAVLDLLEDAAEGFFNQLEK